MPLAHRVIPTFLLKGEMLVKGKQFASDRVIGHAYQAIMIQAARGVDEMVLLDVTATAEGRGPNLELVERLTDALFCPLSVGGGIRSVEDVRAVLRAGADKVVVCTATAEVPGVLQKLADTVGRQAIIVSVDYKMVNQEDWDAPRPCVAVRCGSTALAITNADSNTPMHPVEYAQMCERGGTGEILLQSIDRDGMMEGYDLELIKQVSSAVGIPVIASGGCSGWSDMVSAIGAGASAVAAGALFQFTDATPREAAKYLAANGIEARV